MKLKISDHLSLPLEFVTSTQAILAKRGAGKSYAASVLAEEMLGANQQIVVADPTGAWYGLRSSADGKGEGFPIAVFGGEHGDVPLEQSAGEVIASAIVNERFSAVLDLSLFRKGELNRFMGAFLETLYRLNRQAMHLFLDEADTVAPQRPFGDEARTLGAAEDIVRRGRIKGIGCTMISQRPAVLNKNILTQCDSLLAMRMVHPRDIGAVMEWIAVHGDMEKAKEMTASLPSLPIGDAWFWWPSSDIFKRVTIRRRTTFDSGATPKAGAKIAPPKALAPVDVQKLGKAIAETVERAKENDPKLLKQQLRQARLDLEKARSATPVTPVSKEKRIEIPTLKDRQIQRLETLAGRLEKIGGNLAEVGSGLTAAAREVAAAIGKARQPLPVQRPAPIHRPTAIPPRAAPAPRMPREPRPTNGDGAELGNSGLRRMMIALAQRPGLSATQLAVRAGIARKGGTFRTYLGAGRTNNWITGNGSFELTADGIAALGEFTPLPEGAELLQHWLNELGASGASKMLRALADVYPKTMSKTELSEATGIAEPGGTFRTYLGKLKTLELVQGRGELRASDELF